MVPGPDTPGRAAGKNEQQHPQPAPKRRTIAAHGTTYALAKRGHNEFEAGEYRNTGKHARFFDVQNQKFTTVTCKHCAYTEIYKGDASTLGNILDFVFGG